MQPNYDTGKHWIVTHYLAQPTASPSPSSQNSKENIVTLPVSASEEVIDFPPSYEVAVNQNPNKMTSNPFTLYTKEDHTVAILEEKLPLMRNNVRNASHGGLDQIDPSRFERDGSI